MLNQEIIDKLPFTDFNFAFFVYKDRPRRKHRLFESSLDHFVSCLATTVNYGPDLLFLEILIAFVPEPYLFLQTVHVELLQKTYCVNLSFGAVYRRLFKRFFPENILKPASGQFSCIFLSFCLVVTRLTFRENDLVGGLVCYGEMQKPNDATHSVSIGVLCERYSFLVIIYVGSQALNLVDGFVFTDALEVYSDQLLVRLLTILRLRGFSLKNCHFSSMRYAFGLKIVFVPKGLELSEKLCSCPGVKNNLLLLFACRCLISHSRVLNIAVKNNELKLNSTHF